MTPEEALEQALEAVAAASAQAARYEKSVPAQYRQGGVVASAQPQPTVVNNYYQAPARQGLQPGTVLAWVLATGSLCAVLVALSFVAIGIAVAAVAVAAAVFAIKPLFNKGSE